MLQVRDDFAEGVSMQHQHPHAHEPEDTPGGPSAEGQEVHARFVWTLAGQLVAGLLANPGKQHFSVKDSISLFDEVLHELNSYARVRGDFSEWVHEQTTTHEQRRELQRSVTLGEMRGPLPTSPVAVPEPPLEILQPAPAPNAAPAPASIQQPGFTGGMDLPDLPLPPSGGSAG